MLIYCQKPDATRVAGFHTWKTAFGRNVKKGEHGIMIMAPMVRTKRAKSEGNIVSIDAEPAKFISFRPVYVSLRIRPKAIPFPISSRAGSKATRQSTLSAWSSTSRLRA